MDAARGFATASSSPDDRIEGARLVVSESSAQRYELRDPDVRLMLEVRADSATAFEELMLRYQNRLVMVLEHLVGARDQAEDLAQEVFLRVYRSRKRYVPGSKFSTWLFTIANNVAANARRSRSRRREINLATSDSGAQSAGSLDQLAQAASGLMPTRQLDKAEMRDIVRMAIESLNERQRMAVLLSKFENMSYADIAETMDMSPEAIKSLLSRARVNLKEVLQPYLERGDRPTTD
ncbi:MAG: sigma-70 family RNA polymerase sigma factor [Planctomycetia bacterium]|nr:sigma-70 family RNA polymerase sigma factor [Planctomycetia bacterium]